MSCRRACWTRSYTRPWISAEDSEVGNDPHVTEQEACAIDEYNDAGRVTLPAE